MESSKQNYFPDTGYGIEVFNPPSIQFARRAAGRLREAYSAVTADVIKLSLAQESIAKIYGHDDWFFLSKRMARPGYQKSELDANIPSQALALRLNDLSIRTAKILSIPSETAFLIVERAGLTASRGTPSQENRFECKNGLGRAKPRPGLTEVILTAHPFSFCYSVAPIPLWSSYVVVAAPLDNSALWVRFCGAADVGKTVSKVIDSIIDLTGGSLSKVHIPSKVVGLVPGLVAANSLRALEISSGRQAIWAGRLKARLESALAFVGIDLEDLEAFPTGDEVHFALQLENDIIEIPDSRADKNAPMDFSSLEFGEKILRAVRSTRLDSFAHPSPEVGKKVDIFPPEVSDVEDANSGFGSAVETIVRGAPIYRLRVDLPLVAGRRKANISRVIEVPVGYDLWDLHVAIQCAMGWADYHLHEFTFLENRAGTFSVKFSSPCEDDSSEPTSANEPLADHIEKLTNGKASYLYDFGDGWLHFITLEGTFPSDGGGYPRCIAGDLACPPEDCGSDYGYFKAVDVIAGKSFDDDEDFDREEYINWLKSSHNIPWPYRPDQFDPSGVWFDDPQERWDHAYGNAGELTGICCDSCELVASKGLLERKLYLPLALNSGTFYSNTK